MTQKKQKLDRSLSNRQVQLMAIGGAIGTGLFLGSGSTISQAGPSVLLAYLCTGIFIFFVMRALGELLLSNINYSSFLDFIKDYLGPRIAFYIGWTYWFCWICVAVVDLTATGLYIQEYLPNFPSWIPGLLALITLLLLNLLSVKLFGEIEFWLAIIKIISIIALIVVGIYLIIIGITYYHNNIQIHATISHLYDIKGFFAKGPIGFILSFQMVTMSFCGVEMIGVSASETADPYETLPKSINNIPIRILLFYIGALFVIICIVPWNLININKSPFVEVFDIAGITFGAYAITFVVLSSAISAANSSIFSTSRMLYSLAQNKEAPKVLKKLSKTYVPINSLFFSGVTIFFILLLNFIFPKAQDVFELVAGLATTLFIVVWIAIMITHLLFKFKNKNSAYFKMPFFPISSILTLIFLVFVLIITGILKETQISLFIIPFWFIALEIIYKTILKIRSK